jgi:hypothetical protein
METEVDLHGREPGLQSQARLDAQHHCAIGEIRLQLV